MTEEFPVITDEDRAFAAEAIERARVTAAVRLADIVDLVTERALDPTATPKVVMDAADFCYKVSGMQAKQEPKPAEGSGFRLVINFGDNAPSTRATIDVVPEIVTDPVTEPDFLDNPPAHLVELLPA